MLQPHVTREKLSRQVMQHTRDDRQHRAWKSYDLTGRDTACTTARKPNPAMARRTETQQ
jgi:hypothetical protein